MDDLTDNEIDAILRALEVGTDGMWPLFCRQIDHFQISREDLCSALKKMADYMAVDAPFSEEDFVE